MGSLWTIAGVLLLVATAAAMVGGGSSQAAEGSDASTTARPATRGSAWGLASSTAGTLARPVCARRGVAQFHRAATAYGGETFNNVPRQAARYRMWIAQGYHADLIPVFRASHRCVRGLLYKEAAFAESNTPVPGSHPRNPGGVNYADAVRDHPEWILRDRAGAVIRRVNHPPYVLMDIGRKSYQRAWAANVIHQAKRDGWAGVFADDLGFDLFGVARRPAKYPDAAAWQAAVGSFLAEIYPRFRAANLLFVTNAGGSLGRADVRARWARLTDGMMEEGWMRPTTDPNAPLANSENGKWQAQLEMLEAAERMDKYYLAELPARASDTDAIRYGLATLLLAARGWSSYDVSGTPPYTRPIWFRPDFRDARRLGRPSGAYSLLPSGVFRRDFARGMVLVNPTLRAERVGLDGTYSGSGLTAVASVLMRPTSGLVLLEVPSPGA